MGYEKKFYVRTVKEIRTLVQIWSSSAGSDKYIESDGREVQSIQPEPKKVEVVEAFRRLTPMEERILEMKMPELWEDVAERPYKERELPEANILGGDGYGD